MPAPTFELVVHDERLTIARLAPTAALPSWALGRFVTVSRTPSELSVICAEQHVPPEVTQERGRIAFGIAGTVPMSTIGVLAALTRALAAVEVPVFVVSTYDTDYLLVTAERFERARAALEAEGHTFSGTPPS
ncbi:MAG: ACT domain-containing protein [Planctomycetota bacterium]